ncbi:MAG: Holliday junction branch migration DNA helicase RuvB [Patescibacteria group bacterium]|nr:Holliday junction branch migration DNA helicase RuvB [Patescibacteria group bacterium]
MITSNKQQKRDKQFELTLRPQKMDEYVGQKKLKKALEIQIGAAKERKESLEHVLLFGPSGLGKTTMAHIISKEMGVGIKITSGPAIERIGDFGSILTNLNDGDILFIDEIHRLSKIIEEVLYPAMEDGKLDIIVGKGPSARTIQLELPKFTLIGATTRLGMLSSPLRNRFGVIHKLEFYNSDEIGNIIKRTSSILDMPIGDSASKIIAECSRSTPRIANRLLKRVRDYAQVNKKDIIDKKIVEEALDMLNVDCLGLEASDRELLKILISKFEGGPVGVQTIAAAFSEEAQTIEEVYEPYLLQVGMLERTPRGRKATKAAYRHLGIKYQENNQISLL